MDIVIEKLKEKYSDKCIYLYYKNKPILTAKNIKELKQSIKDNIKNPNKDIKVFTITFVYNTNPKKVFRINCAEKTITTELDLVTRDFDLGQSIIYSDKELEKFGFKKNHLTSIIKLIKNGDMPYDVMQVSITKIISLSKKK